MQDDDVPGGGQPPAPPQFSVTLRDILAALRANDHQTAHALLNAFLSSESRFWPTFPCFGSNTPATNNPLQITLMQLNLGNKQFIYADTHEFFANTLWLAWRAGDDELMNKLCYCFPLLAHDQKKLQQICQFLGERGATAAILKLADNALNLRQHILDTALIGAVASGNGNSIADLVNHGANQKIGELGVWNAQARLSLREALSQVKLALENNFPAVALLWLKRYFDGCAPHGGNPIQGIGDDVDHVVDQDDDNTLYLLIYVLRLACACNAEQVSRELCRIVAVAIEKNIGLDALWKFLVDNELYDVMHSLSNRVSLPETSDYIHDVCLVHAVRKRKTIVVRRLLLQGASPAVTILGRRILYGNQIDPNVHMPLIDICMNHDLVGTNLDTALILMAHGAPCTLGQGQISIDCLIAYIEDGEWNKLARLCSLGVSCTGFILVLSTDPGHLTQTPDANGLEVILEGIREALTLLYRLPAQLALQVLGIVMAGLHPLILTHELQVLRNQQAYASIAGIIDETITLLSADYATLHPRITGGLSTISPILFTQEDFNLFMAACQSQHPPTLTELLAWIRLYEMDDPAVMSRDELVNLILRRCFPQIDTDESMDDTESDESGG